MTKQEALEQIDKLKAYIDGIKDTDKERDEWFLSILNGLVMEVRQDFVIYRDSLGDWVFQDMKNGKVYYSYRYIYLILKDRYNMQISDIDAYIKDMLLKHTGWRVETTQSMVRL